MCLAGGSGVAKGRVYVRDSRFLIVVEHNFKVFFRNSNQHAPVVFTSVYREFKTM